MPTCRKFCRAGPRPTSRRSTPTTPTPVPTVRMRPRTSASRPAPATSRLHMMRPATSSWPTTHAPTRKFTPVPRRVACSNQDRNTWVKAVNVRANGMLDMSLTKDQEVAPANRTVTITVTVGEPDTPVEPSITGIRVKSEPTKTKYTVGEQFSADGLVIEATMCVGRHGEDARCRRLHGRRRGHVRCGHQDRHRHAQGQRSGFTTSFVVTVSAKTEPG